MFGFSFAFICFAIMLVWGVALETRSTIPRVVRGLYGTVGGALAISLLMGVWALSIAGGSAMQAATIMHTATGFAQIAVLCGILGMTLLTGHRFATGPVPVSDDQPDAS